MKNKKLLNRIATLSFIFSIFFTTNTFASNFGNWMDLWKNMQSQNTKGHTSVPIDGGMGILVLGAAAFGAYKLRGKKNA
ncbi:hypothetical protein PK35_04050 [Tamlana nanhaiensis]|uniref:VPDSG-CTERM protein sorting domain-containing protein n=1 Tax=Neotamlana nanhaiensis TaxID=1382798 RepID=A0A0D7W7W7_9FLAO|nr:hypothetical protein [Tamlana nanhaiensis]KJD33917.1 hypothetical protein PK35_04050 [Tamlana nanhaiensis]